MDQQHYEIDRVRVTPIEFKWHLQQLVAAGYVEQKTGTDFIKLTDRGITHALELERRLGTSNVLILEMFYELLQGILEEEK